MSADPQGDEVGKWKKEGILGAGGFGYVVLWRNKVWYTIFASTILNNFLL